MSNSHVRSAKAIAEAVAYFCSILVIGDGGLLILGRLVSQVCRCPLLRRGISFGMEGKFEFSPSRNS